MFDIGWSEMLVIAVVTLVVLGPKELPHALKTFSHWMRAARKLGSEFQSGVNEIVREAELDDAKNELQKLSVNSISQKIEKAIDPSGDLKKAITTPVDEAKAALSQTDSTPESMPVASVADLPPFPGGSQPVQTPAVAAVEATPANADPLPADLQKSDKSISA